ncbi:alpha/beta hydrolase [Phenylobacterium sp. LjRoot219]|uniref:alpha/beta hydrolase n=1 Tax=Phenylobacterium sp. LjRoot219 TaxID=3342283 RepID=UPI003ED0529C
MSEQPTPLIPAPRATFVLVHGGGHGGWCWSRLARLLRAARCDVYTPTLTGLGERAHLLTPEIGLETHIEDVVNLLFYEDLTNVILVGHSYGGMVVTGVADRALERIAQIVYFDAAIPRDGESLADTSPGLRKFAHVDTRIVADVPLVLWPGPITKALYGVREADWAWMEPRLTPHPLRTFEEPLRLTDAAALARLPRTIINCTPTLKVREKETLDRWFEADRVWEIDTGHDLMITEPEASADMLLRLI